MQGLRVLTRSGASPTAEEIASAHIVANTHKEMKFGAILATEQANGVEVEYHAHKNMAFVSGGEDYVGVTLPNPIPYRGVVISWTSYAPLSDVAPYIVYPPSSGACSDVLCCYHGGAADANTGGAGYPYLSCWQSNGGGVGGSLASKPSPYSVWSGSYLYVYTGYGSHGYADVSGGWTDLEPAARAIMNALNAERLAKAAVLVWTSDGGMLRESRGAFYNVVTTWNGAGYVSATPASAALSFAVPEDCLAPAPAASNVSPQKENYALWRARKLAWYRKNSEAVIAELLGAGKSLPRGWDYSIKRAAPRSNNTYRKTLMTNTVQDAVVSDTSAGLTTSGTKITQRAATLEYGGRRETIIGQLTQTLTEHKNNSYSFFSREDTYTNWYVPPGTANPSGASYEAKLLHAVLLDNSNYGFGLVWDGAVQALGGYHKDSTFSAPATYSPAVYSPPPPEFKNTLAGVAPAFVRQYRKDVPVVYDKENLGLGNTAWNDSAMSAGMRVVLILFGPVKDGVSFGVFSDPADRMGATQFEVYGKAKFKYDAEDGSLSFVGWGDHHAVADIPRVPQSEALVPWPAYNCVVRYESLKWPDVVGAAQSKSKQRKDGGGDRFMNAVLAALKL